MNKPTATPESFADMQFPIFGLDVSDSYSGQRPGTTAIGQNVRAFDPLAQRARGGSRPGMERWIDSALPGAVQNLDVIVTTYTPTRQIGVPTATVSGTVITIVSQSPATGPDATAGSYTTGLTSAGGDTEDPSDGGRALLADGSTRRVRTGGSGLYTNKDQLPLATTDGTDALTIGLKGFVVMKAFKVNVNNAVGGKLVLANCDLADCLIVYVTARNASPTISLSDSQGSTYSLLGTSYDAGDPVDASTSAYRATPTAGPNILTFGASAGAMVTVVHVAGSKLVVGSASQVELTASTGAQTYQAAVSLSHPAFAVSYWQMQTTPVSTITGQPVAVNSSIDTDLGFGVLLWTGPTAAGSPAFPAISVTSSSAHAASGFFVGLGA